MSQDLEAKERQAGSKAASAIRTAMRSTIKSTFKRRSGNLEKSNVSARYRQGRLDRLALTQPHYSFKEHYGSTKTGTTPNHSREGASVRTFSRVVAGKSQQVQAHRRSGGPVGAHRKGRKYEAKNHISEALKSTNALEVLATSLGENRIVEITSQINF